MDWSSNSRETSSDHVGESICDRSTILLDLSHVGIDLLGRGRFVESNLLLLVGV